MRSCVSMSGCVLTGGGEAVEMVSIRQVVGEPLKPMLVQSVDAQVSRRNGGEVGGAETEGSCC